MVQINGGGVDKEPYYECSCTSEKVANIFCSQNIASNIKMEKN